MREGLSSACDAARPRLYRFLRRIFGPKVASRVGPARYSARDLGRRPGGPAGTRERPDSAPMRAVQWGVFAPRNFFALDALRQVLVMLIGWHQTWKSSYLGFSNAKIRGACHRLKYFYFYWQHGELNCI